MQHTGRPGQFPRWTGHHQSLPDFRPPRCHCCCCCCRLCHWCCCCCCLHSRQGRCSRCGSHHHHHHHRRPCCCRLPQYQRHARRHKDLWSCSWQHYPAARPAPAAGSAAVLPVHHTPCRPADCRHGQLQLAPPWHLWQHWQPHWYRQRQGHWQLHQYRQQQWHRTQRCHWNWHRYQQHWCRHR